MQKVTIRFIDTTAGSPAPVVITAPADQSYPNSALLSLRVHEQDKYVVVVKEPPAGSFGWLTIAAFPRENVLYWVSDEAVVA